MLSAKPLWDIMRAILAEETSHESHPLYQERADLKNLLGFMEDEFGSLAHKRNDMLHGTWLIGYTSYSDPHGEKFRVRKFKTSADGLIEAKEMPQDVTELSAITRRCDDLRTWVAEIEFCISKNRPLSTQFKRIENKWYHRLLPSSEDWKTLQKKPAQASAETQCRPD
jgi:hypothetical protein